MLTALFPPRAHVLLMAGREFVSFWAALHGGGIFVEIIAMTIDFDRRELMNLAGLGVGALFAPRLSQRAAAQGYGPAAAPTCAPRPRTGSNTRAQ